jgi:short-subunit dehydrogenase
MVPVAMVNGTMGIEYLYTSIFKISMPQFLQLFNTGLILLTGKQNCSCLVIIKNKVMETIKGKRILLFGATGGIGAKVAELLIGGGATVFMLARNAQKLEDLAAALSMPAGQTFTVDITDAAAVEAVVAAVVSGGGVDILINAVGVGIIKPIETLTHQDFTDSLQINLVGSFNVVKAVLPSMKEAKKGLIINIPGVLGKVPMAGAAAYSASKYGIVGMMQSIREELKRTEIRITNLFLGGVDSPFWDTIDLRVQKDKMIVVEEAAKAIWFLCQQPRSGVVSEMVLQPFNHQAI